MEQDNIIGRTIDKYEIIDEIARGGMATVYKARQPSINRTVAVKVIDAEYAKDPTLMQRFRREVELIARLQHPHILPVYDYGQIDGRPYIVMAFMPGGSVHDLIVAPGHMALDTIVRIVNQTADALDHAHADGVIHRDLKPSNILLDRSGNAHLADFGIAKVLAEDTQGLTGDRIIGTLSYMAPEMFRKQDLTPAIDIYALGVTVYQMLVEETPYKGDTAQVIGAHLHEAVPDVRSKRPELPTNIGEVVRKAMAKYPDERYASSGEFAIDFQRAVRGEALVGTVRTEKVPKAERPATPPPSRPTASSTPSATETLVEDQWYHAPNNAPPSAPYIPPQPQMQQPQGGYYAPQPPPPAPRRRQSRGGGGVSIALMIGVILVLLMCVLAGGVGAYLYFGGPQPSQVDSPNTTGDNGTAPTALPLPPATDLPTATEPPAPGEPTAASTAPVLDQEAVRQSVLAFDEAMRLILETGDRSTIGNVARGTAYQKRIDAADTLASDPRGNCHWDYNHNGIEFLSLEEINETQARVLGNVQRSGTVFCDDGEHPEYSFTGPYTALFIVEYADGQWWVIDYCSYDNCTPEQLGE